MLDYSPTYSIHVIHAVVPTVGQIVRGRGIQEIKANKDAFSWVTYNPVDRLNKDDDGSPDVITFAGTGEAP
jgi:hypothetical protein